MKFILFFSIFYIAPHLFAGLSGHVRVGSKVFTESYVLAEIISQVLERQGLTVERRFGLGATGIAFESLKNNEIDILPEYTGTIAQAILKKEISTVSEINKELAPYDLTISKSLGFNNTYVFGFLKKSKLYGKITKMTELKNYPDLKYSVDHEFSRRKDGLKALERHYNYEFKHVSELDHNLAYQVLEEGQVDIINLYSTDAKIKKIGIELIEDDLSFFPNYDAVAFASKKWIKKNQLAWQKLIEIQGAIDEKAMVELNAMVELDKLSFAQAARRFLNSYYKENRMLKKKKKFDLIKLTQEHLFLVFISLIASICVALPLGILGSLHSVLGQGILTISGLLQTIPSLALLCFLIPFFGIGTPPALIALFLYGLLPIVRNTYVGLTQIESGLKESARSLGLSRWQQLRFVELPLAMPSILAGIKTSAIINVGTATLASFIGAGGYGTPIVTGLALNETSIMLYGALPAAGLAVILHCLFEFIDRWVLPKGLRI